LKFCRSDIVYCIKLKLHHIVYSVVVGLALANFGISEIPPILYLFKVFLMGMAFALTKSLDHSQSFPVGTASSLDSGSSTVYLLTYLLTYILNYLLTCIHTYLLHGAESFLRS